MSARLRNLNPYELHKYLVNIYCLNKKGSTGNLKRDTSRDRTDLDVIRENHKFLWDDDDIADTWEKQLAKKYYDKLFKEYCICDLSKYKESKNKFQPSKPTRWSVITAALNIYNTRGVAIALPAFKEGVALRWRLEREVVLGKGQFQCGAKQCNSDQDLKSWEVNFAYVEDNEKKNALVKLRLCPECSEKLNYKSKKREVKRLKKFQKKKKKNNDTEDDDNVNEAECPIATENQSEPSTSKETVGSDQNKDESLWKKGVQEIEEKTREEEFEEYLEDLLL